MREIFTEANYRFLGINDRVRALASLLRHKPNFIFEQEFLPALKNILHQWYAKNKAVST